MPECLSILVSDGALQALLPLLHLPDVEVETAAAELLAKLAAIEASKGDYPELNIVPQTAIKEMRKSIEARAAA